MAIDGARIQRVTQEGLYYLDDEGGERFINFAECYKTGIAQYRQFLIDYLPALTDQEREERVKDYKRAMKVADRNFDPGDTLPYIEFYTDPRTYFEFATLDKFYEVRFLIDRKTRWKTRDMG